MRVILCLVILFFAAGLISAELDNESTVRVNEIYKNLGDSSFRVRRAAKKKVSTLSVSEVLVLYNMLQKSGDPELELIANELSSFVDFTLTETVVGAKYSSLDDLAKGSKEAQANQRKAAEKNPLETRLVKSNIVFRLIPKGVFTMGSPKAEKSRSDDEVQRQVTITQNFYIGKFEITQKQWKKVMGSNPSAYKSENAPVENISWDDCMIFIQKLEKLEGFKPGTLALPTAAEWEYTCRAGTKTATCYGDLICSKNDNFDGNDPYGDAPKGPNVGHPCDVGKFKANAWGVYDMHGNVSEWTSDRYAATTEDAVVDPQGAKTGTERILLGGSWRCEGEYCRSSDKEWEETDYVEDYIGFRIVLRLRKEKK